jgi:hypothetical protein
LTSAWPVPGADRDVVSSEKVLSEPSKTGSAEGGLDSIHWRVCWPDIVEVVVSKQRLTAREVSDVDVCLMKYQQQRTFSLSTQFSRRF